MKPKISYKIENIDILFVLISFIILFMMLLTTDERYLDFGDGVHLYVSSRLADGIVLYKDVLAPHPPLLFAVGAILIKIDNSVMTMRLFNIILGVATSFLIYLLSFKVFADKRTAFFAGAIYYVMPIHLIWGRGFEADSLMIFFALLAFTAIISMNPRGMILASLFSVLALLTKYSFLPFLLFTVGYLFLKRKSLLRYYLMPLIIMLSASILVLNLYSSGMFVQSTFIVQGMSSFNDIFAIEKTLIGFFSIEGPLLLASILGMLLFMKTGKKLTDYLIGCTLASFVPLALTVRQGTGLYIIYGAEPFIAIFAAYLLTRVTELPTSNILTHTSRRSLINRRHWKRFLIGFFTVALLFNPVLDLCTGQFLNFSRYDNWSNAPQVQQIAEYIDEYTSLEDFILSPPYFAFITKRRLLYDYADTWLWKLAYEQDDAEATKIVQRLAANLKDGTIKLVILDHRMRSIEPINKAISENYQLIYKATIIENFGSIHHVVALDTIEVYIPHSSIDLQ